MTEEQKSHQEREAIGEEKTLSEGDDVFQNVLVYLNPLKGEKLKGWIFEFLFYGETLNISIPPKGTSPSLVLIGIYKRASSNIQKRIEESVRELILEWDVNSGSPEFFNELLVLVAELKLYSVYNTLLEYAKKEGGVLKGKHANGIDLHLVLLRTLFSFPSNPDIEIIAKRDINHYLYTELAFEKLWQSKDGFSKGINDLRILFKVYEEYQEIDIEFALEGFFIALGPDNFVELLQDMLHSVSIRYQKTFLSICKDVGIIMSNLLIKKGWESEEVIRLKEEGQVLVNISWGVYGTKEVIKYKKAIEKTPPIMEFLQEEDSYRLKGSVGAGITEEEVVKKGKTNYEEEYSKDEEGVEVNEQQLSKAEQREKAKVVV